jgi:hypothetical protein
LAYCSKLSNRLLEKLATPMALVSPSSTVCSKASQVLLMSSGRKSSCRGGNPEPFLNFNGQCMRYKSRYSNCKSLCTHNNVLLQLCLSLTDCVCYLHLAIGQSITDCKDGGSFPVLDHPQIQNVKVFCGKGMKTQEEPEKLLTLCSP